MAQGSCVGMKGANLAGHPPNLCILADLPPSIKGLSSCFPRGAPLPWDGVDLPTGCT
jgi:hypothetical protein